MRAPSAGGVNVDSVWVSVHSYFVFSPTDGLENTCHAVRNRLRSIGVSFSQVGKCFQKGASGAASLPGDVGMWGRNSPADCWESMPRLISLA